MSWLRRAAAVASACLVAIAIYAGASVSAQEPQQKLDQDQKKMVVDCAAVYRWQAGPDDPSYKKLQALYQQFAGLSAIVADQSLSINRDKYDAAVASGKLTSASIQKWLDRCADFTTLAAPPGPVRSAAFPERPKPESVTGLLDCLALSRWQMGPFTYNLIVARDRYLAYARLTDDGAEEATNAEIKRRVDNIDKALLAGAGSLEVLALAREACLRDYSVIITSSDERRMSLEYETEHPPAPSSALADVDINQATATIPSPGTSYSSRSTGSGGAGSPPPSYAFGSDGRILSSSGMDLTNVTSSSECVAAMDAATRIMQPDLDKLTEAMAFDKKYCAGDFECEYTSNNAAVLACGSIQRARPEVPSQCLKERAIMDNLREKVCPQ